MCMRARRTRACACGCVINWGQELELPVDALRTGDRDTIIDSVTDLLSGDGLGPETLFVRSPKLPKLPKLPANTVTQLACE